MTREAAVLLGVFAFMVAASIATPLMASASATPSVGIADGAGQSALDHEGIDPAEIQARENRIGYHEQRKFPYGMVVFLIAFTVFSVPWIVAYREPTRRDAP